MERADKILANTGRWSRKEAKELIRAGRFYVNGKLVSCPEEKIEESAALIVDGEWILHSAYTYLMMNKPAGILSSTEDRQKTVIDLLPEHMQRIGLFPVGRLDKDTVGLLLITNDGDLAHQLLSPKKHVDKVYFVRVQGVLDQADVTSFQSGMVLKDGLHCLPAELVLSEAPNEGFVTLREGKFHQIKRMFDFLGKPVVFLKRLSMGSLTLDPRLEEGGWRPLTCSEQEELKKFGNLNKKEEIAY